MNTECPECGAEPQGYTILDRNQGSGYTEFFCVECGFVWSDDDE